MERDDVRLEVQEEARLVGGVDATLPPQAGHELKVAHPHAARRRAHSGGADVGQHARRRVVVRAADHRVDEPVVGGAQRARAHARVVEVGDQEEGLDDARRVHALRSPIAAEPAIRADGEADLAPAVVDVAQSAFDVG